MTVSALGCTCRSVKRTHLVQLLVASTLATLAACGSGSTEPDGPKAESGQITVSSQAARGCEALVEATGGKVLAVEFGAGATGKLVLEGDRAGLSFISTSADPLPSKAGTIRFTGRVKVLSSTCYGEAGAALAGDGVQL